MNKVTIPSELSYLAAFLTFRCTFGCPYCINRYKHLARRPELTSDQWIAGLSRLDFDRDLMVPLTLQGGEPSVHKEFLEIIKGLKSDLYIDLLTNLDFNIDHFMSEIPPERLQRDVPYASIRVSYHPQDSKLEPLLDKMVTMQDRGYSVGLFAVEHPETDIAPVRQASEARGIDFRTKEFLGEYNGELHGQYQFDDACNAGKLRSCDCRTTEILIAPNGDIHRCHRDLYHGEFAVGNILDPDLKIEFTMRPCDKYGECNPCDIKLKNNRFQEFGACSVEIENISNG